LIAVHGGFISVQDDRVIILSDIAEVASQIDVERARRAQERAEAELHQSEDVEAEASLRRARARLKAAGDGGS
jgi:F-type H+-transporting ATPase subunit epsilon